MSENDLPHRCPRSSTRWTVMAAALVISALACPHVAAQSPARQRVTEIRFGLIDPPVVLQQDITASFETSNNNKTPKPIECAGMAYVDGALLLLSDRHEHVVFSCAIDLLTMRIEAPKKHEIIANEQNLLQDGEAITVLQTSQGSHWAYVMCSMSNHRTEQPLPMRRHMARFSIGPGPGFSPGKAAVIDGSPVREKLSEYFDKLGVQSYRTFFNEATTRDKNTYRWANIEGITFTPDGANLMVGFRNPLTAGDKGGAIIATLSGLTQAFDAGDAQKISVSDIFTLDLGDRGVSDLAWDPMTKGYLIAAGKSNGLKVDKDQPFPPNTLDSAVFWWSGRKTEKPILFATAPDMKIEAVCRLGNTRFIALASDEGDESEGRDQRQSVITVMDFTGFD